MKTISTVRPIKLAPFKIPKEPDAVTLNVGCRQIHLSHLHKLFWPALGITKRDLLQYYADVSPVLLPHVQGRALVMKRYPNGADRDFR